MVKLRGRYLGEQRGRHMGGKTAGGWENGPWVCGQASGWADRQVDRQMGEQVKGEGGGQVVHTWQAACVRAAGTCESGGRRHGGWQA